LTESKAADKVIELAEIKAGESILEVAVGTGMLFERIVRMNESGVNEGIDISPDMLSRAENRLKKGGTHNYHLQLGNASTLPFKPEEFDLVVNSFMLDLLPEESLGVVLSEFLRVLKPGGRVVISTMTFGSEWYHGFWQWLARHCPGLLTGCRPINIGPYLQEAGFGNLTVHFVSQNTFPSEVVRAEKMKR
jgi:ubiquinone/menaquinone biosynthesis C-methylase UbiE